MTYIDMVRNAPEKSEDIMWQSVEAVAVQDAERILGGIDNAQDKRWDAYVGVNGFMHDMAKSDLSSRAIMELAKMFWFEDEDFQGKSKVFWYYSSM